MSSEEYSRQLQEKFEFYLLALVFTILGLAIQTAKFGVSDLGDVLELFGWVLLLASGITGLSRLEWLPVAHANNGKLKTFERQRDELQQLADAGVTTHPVEDRPDPVPIDEVIRSRDLLIAKGKKELERIERATLLKYSWHKWTFVVALLVLAVARGYPAASTLAERHLTLRSSGTSTGKSLGPPAGVVNHPSSGPSALPASAPQLKR